MRGETVKDTQKKLKEVILESGIKVKPIYTPEDVKKIDYKKDIQNPGEYPYTRGIHPFMYCARPWTMRQYSGFSPREHGND